MTTWKKQRALLEPLMGTMKPIYADAIRAALARLDAAELALFHARAGILGKLTPILAYDALVREQDGGSK